MKLLDFEVGLEQPFFLIAGPCVIESRQMALESAQALKEITAALGVPFIYKSSYDKANRTSSKSFRGLGLAKGLEILAEVRERVGVPVLTDVHTEAEVTEALAALDDEARDAACRAGGRCAGRKRPPGRRQLHGHGNGAPRRTRSEEDPGHGRCSRPDNRGMGIRRPGRGSGRQLGMT